AAGAGNVISGNTTSGISLGGDGNQVQGNWIGTNLGGTAALGNGLGVSVSGADNTIGGATAQERNGSSGNTTSGDSGVHSLLGLPGNLVQGNYLGTNATGSAALGNQVGVAVSGSNNVIGGTTTAERNLISGNDTGVLIRGGGNQVQGNYIGTGVGGATALAN